MDTSPEREAVKSGAVYPSLEGSIGFAFSQHQVCRLINLSASKEVIMPPPEAREQILTAIAKLDTALAARHERILEARRTAPPAGGSRAMPKNIADLNKAVTDAIQVILEKAKDGLGMGPDQHELIKRAAAAIQDAFICMARQDRNEALDPIMDAIETLEIAKKARHDQIMTTRRTAKGTPAERSQALPDNIKELNDAVTDAIQVILEKAKAGLGKEPGQNELVKLATGAIQSSLQDPGKDPYGPTDEEIDKWLQDQRRQRKEYVEGPTPEDTVAWKRAIRRRRLLEAAVAGDLEDEEAQKELDDAIDRERRALRRKLYGNSERVLFALGSVLLSGLATLKEGNTVWKEGYRRRRV